MSRAEDQEAIIKKWVVFFQSSDAQIEFKDVIVCLANVGLLQLQLEQKMLEASTSTKNPHLSLSRLDNLLEEMYRNVGDILQCQNSPLALELDKWDTSKMVEGAFDDKVLTRKLQCIVNAVKLTVTGSLEAFKKFRNSNFLYFIRMIDDAFVRCPWRTERDDEPPPAFIYECPEVSTKLAYSLVDSCEIERSISTLLILGDLIEKTGFEIVASPRAEDATNRPPAPSSEIWTTDSIMECIFKCLPAIDCLRLRTVNQRFNHFAVQNLHRYYSDVLKLEFEYDLETTEFVCSKLFHGIYHKLKLTHLTNTMKPYSRFPCVNFSFVKGTIASPDIQGFLDAHGTQIKIFHLHLYCEPEYFYVRGDKPGSAIPMPCPSQLVTLLTRQAPEIQTLTLQGFPEKWVLLSNYMRETTLRIFPTTTGENAKLKNLKILQFVSAPPKDLVRELLALAVNLEHIYGIQFIDPFIQTDRFHLLDEFIWEINIQPVGMAAYNKVQVKDFDTFNDQFKSDSVSNLTKLGIFLPIFSVRTVVPPGLNCLVSKIIEGSARTLQSFHLMGNMGIFHELRFPVLPQLKELLLTSRPQYASCHQYAKDPMIPFFPPGFSPAQVFPALEKITIGFILMRVIVLKWDECLGNCFKNSGPLLTVKCLEIQEFRDLPQGWLENLALVCPCVEDINVKTILYNFPEDAVKGLWNFKKLKSLKLKINIWAVENAFPAVDSVFTGFSSETCLELFNTNGNGIEQTDLESLGNLRAHASLLDLKELTRLQVTFVDLSLPQKMWEHPIMTQVTGLYAFQMCPQLKVCIEAEGRTPELSLKLMQGLEHLYPYVHLHIPNNCPSEHLKNNPGFPGFPGSSRGNVYNDVVSCAGFECK